MLYFSTLKSFSDRLKHGITQAHEGDFNDEQPEFKKKLEQFTQQQNLPRPPELLKQTHSKRVLDFPCKETLIQQGDALITRQGQWPLMVKTADCQGIIVYAPDVHALGVIHSGWRGSVQNIVGKTIARMTEAYGADPGRMQAAIGPSLGPCCAIFSDPKKELPAFCKPFIQEQQVDFWALTLEQCRQAGLLDHQVELSGQCTRCQPGYFSHRRGERERFMTWAMLL